MDDWVLQGGCHRTEPLRMLLRNLENAVTFGIDRFDRSQLMG